MSIRWISEVWENGPAESTRRFILLSLADNANDDGECYPSIAVISRKCCVKERMVQYHLKALEQDGFVTIQRGQGRGNRSLYQLLRPWLEKVQPIAPLSEEKVQPIAPLSEEKVQPIAPLSPEEKVQPIAPLSEKRCNLRQEKVQPIAPPFNSFNRQEPSIKNQPSFPPEVPVELPSIAEEDNAKLAIVPSPPRPTAALAVRGIPLNAEIENLVTMVVLATPWARIHHWRSPQVTDEHRKVVLRAAEEEGDWHGRSLAETLEGLAKWIHYHTQDLSRAQLKMLGGVEKYFREAKHRTTREEFMQEVSDGKPTKREQSDALFASANEQLRRSLGNN